MSAKKALVTSFSTYRGIMEAYISELSTHGLPRSINRPSFDFGRLEYNVSEAVASSHGTDSTEGQWLLGLAERLEELTYASHLIQMGQQPSDKSWTVELLETNPRRVPNVETLESTNRLGRIQAQREALRIDFKADALRRTRILKALKDQLDFFRSDERIETTEASDLSKTDRDNGVIFSLKIRKDEVDAELTDRVVQAYGTLSPFNLPGATSKLSAQPV